MNIKFRQTERNRDKSGTTTRKVEEKSKMSAKVFE